VNQSQQIGWYGSIRKRLEEKNKGQALVEFTLVFILLIIVAWIPADFGLAFYTGQLALNASRDGARIAAADRTLVPGTTTCTMPCTSANGILQETAKRVSSALMPGASISLTLQGGSTCDRLVTVSINGQYQFFFYQAIRLLGFSVPNGTVISRSTSMRWEHQC
jgi:hypothetical protein